MKIHYSLKEIGDRVRRLREEEGMSQAILAKKILRDQSSIAKIEGGKIKLTSPMRRSICGAFGVREAWLLTGTGPKYTSKLIYMKQLEEKSKELSAGAQHLFNKMKDSYGLREETKIALSNGEVTDGTLISGKDKLRLSHYDLFKNPEFFEMFKELSRIYDGGDKTKIDILEKILKSLK